MDTPQPTADEIQARVLYRDGLMLVIDKRPAFPCIAAPRAAPTSRHRSTRCASACRARRFLRTARPRHLRLPGARPPPQGDRLARAAVQHGKVSKTYWAVVEGGPEADEGEIDIPLGRLNAERGWWQKPDPNGLPSKTTWKVLGRFLPPTSPLAGEVEREAFGRGVMSDGTTDDPPPHPSPAKRAFTPVFDGLWGEGADRARGNNAIAPSNSSHHGRDTRLTWLALEPITGRTHQLRVHCAASGWPIVGDNIYGNGPRFGEPSLHLHAREIVIPLSKNKPPVRVTRRCRRISRSGCGCAGGGARKRILPSSLRAKRSNPVLDESWIASSLRSSQ